MCVYSAINQTGYTSVQGSKVLFHRGTIPKQNAMTKEIFKVTTTTGKTFEVIADSMFGTNHYLKLKEALKNNINDALGLKLVKSIKYVGKAIEVR